MSIVNILTQLNAIITSIQTSAGINSIFSYMPTEMPKTPCVAILLDESGEIFSTSGQNTLNANFIVRIMVLKNSDDSTQVNKLLTVLDAVLDELRDDDNQYLNCNGYYVLSTGISPVRDDKVANEPVWYVDIKLETKAFKTI
jgi:hypothetical protein